MSADRHANATTLVDVDPCDSLSAERGRGAARIAVLVGPSVGRTYPVGERLSIGRSNEADLAIHDPAVSRVHVEIVRTASGNYELVDQGSRNGTLVDGVACERMRLQHGSRIQLGPRCLLLFTAPAVSEEALLQAQQIDLMAKMSAGFSHDFNNLLCTMTANAAHLRELPPGMTLGHLDVRECLDDLHAAAAEGAELTKRLEPFACSAAAPDEPVNLSALYANYLQELRQTLPREIALRDEIQSGLSAFGREDALRQLLLHAYMNACEAMHGGGTLTCTLCVCEADALPAQPIVRAEHHAVLQMRDTGHGMDPEVCARAFDPFFTTKAVAVGRGLGLTIVRKIVHDLGGAATLTSELGVGTTLSLVLPVQTQAEAGAAREGDALTKSGRVTLDARPSSESGTRVVLVVDDNAGVRRVVARALARAGFETLEASDGVDALAVFGAAASMISCVVLDLDMPRMDGRQCLQELRARRADLPTLVLSGAVHMGKLPDGQGAPTVSLRKPIDPVRLLSAVEALLASAAHASR